MTSVLTLKENHCIRQVLCMLMLKEVQGCLFQ